MRGTAMLLVAAAVAAAAPARLSKGKPGVVVRRNYALPEGVTAVSEPACLQARVRKDVMLFFDVDGNGRFDDAGVDGWSLTKMPFMLPFEEHLVTGPSVYRVAFADDLKTVQWDGEALPLDQRGRLTFVEFNTWRLMNGLPGVVVDEALSKGCALHCAYMEKHGFQHEEREDRDGYTKEGAEAGLRSCLSESGARFGVRLFYASFYHRLPLMHPDTRAVGIGTSARYTAVNGYSNRKPRPWRYPILVPAPGSWFQPTHFAREQPDPLPTDAGEACGFPLTLTFPDADVKTVKAELRHRNEKGKLQPVYVSSPEFPAHPRRPKNRNSICVIPRTPLRPKTTYWARVSWVRGGIADERSWVFKTGAAGPVPRRR